LDLLYNNGEGVSESAGLLISILMRYPEICAISYNPDDNHISLSFSFAGSISEERFRRGSARLNECLATYSYLEGKQPPQVTIHWTTMEKTSLLKVEYDVNAVSKGEIALIISFLQEEFGDCLMRDLEIGDPISEDDLLLQDEFISYMLEKFKGAVPRKKLIAFREEGKVHVFKK